MKPFLFFALVSLAATVTGQSSSNVVTHFNLSKDKLALSGFDPVAYFSGKPVEGNSAISYEYRGVKYFFSSEENKQRLMKEPSKYEPQYGGWCAYAMGNDGSKVNIDPETFKIMNGKLYVFYNKFFNNTLKSWNKDETNLNKKADANWQKTVH